MKPSHRKDVILARLIFAVFCLAVIVGAGTLTVKIIKNHNARVAEAEATEKGDTEVVVTGLEDLTETTEVEVTETVTLYVETTTSVNLRSQPGTDGEIITLLDSGVQMEKVSDENGWTQVIYDGQTGYVSSDFVQEVASAAGDGSQTADAAVTMKTTDSVRMRTGAGTDYDIVTTVPAGTEVTVTGEENGWKMVEYDGRTGYIRTDFLE